MSNLLNRGLIRPVNFEHQNKLNSSCVPAVSVYQTSTVNPAVGKIGRSNLGTKLYGRGLKKAGPRLITETGRSVSFVPRAVLAMDPASQVNLFFLMEICLECDRLLQLLNVC